MKSILTTISILILIFSCSNPDSIDKARSLMGQGKYEDAIRVLDNLQKTNPDLDSIYLERGYAYIMIGQHQKALKDFNKLLKNPQLKIAAMEARAFLYNDLGDLESAILEYSIIIKNDSSNYYAYYSRGILKESNIIYGKNTDTVFSKGYTTINGIHQYNDLSGAMSDYDKAISLNPSFTEAYIARGRIFLEIEKFDNALLELNKATENDSNNYQAYLYRGLLYKRIDKHSKSLNEFNKAIELNPNDPIVYLNRGYLKRESFDDPNGACEDFRKAASLGMPDTYNEDCN